MIEDTLWECLSAGLLAQHGHETERLRHWQVGLHLHQRRALTGVLLEDAPAPQIHAIVHSAHGILWASDLKKNTGSCNVGLAVNSAAKHARRNGGMIWPAPRWMASA